MSRAERRRLERIRFQSMSGKKSLWEWLWAHGATWGTIRGMRRRGRRAYVREMGLHKLREENE